MLAKGSCMRYYVVKFDGHWIGRFKAKSDSNALARVRKILLKEVSSPAWVDRPLDFPKASLSICYMDKVGDVFSGSVEEFYNR